MSVLQQHSKSIHQSTSSDDTLKQMMTEVLKRLTNLERQPPPPPPPSLLPSLPFPPQFSPHPASSST
ncbi:hypothetical protein Syun_021181 [Stephania yunnanensis]|uniref:Uncharacterized protein n=1 Tax=Stephania yunnanensis TaxID=152371 RepID=A0AAP0NQG7_9MAGN